MFKKVKLVDFEYRAEIYNKANGTPLRMFDVEYTKVDLSRLSDDDMGI
ncbi:MAG: hypothetical protein VYE18_05790 [Pseudomonadota bacterium]|nr:hypothetical protein [Pseudomonadota bacterium]